jgi:Fe2+ transport system protein B
MNWASMGSNAPSAPENTVKRTIDKGIPSQIIQNATINCNVSSADSSHIRIRQLIQEYNAYLNLDKRMQSPEAIVQRLQIRVSPENFEKLVDAIMKESIFTENKDISADDVTAQFVDMEGRLKSKRDVEKRYTELLSKAQKINDILVIESNRRQIQEEIESMEGNLRLMRDQVAYSTIYLTITQKIKEVVKTPEPEKQMTFMEQMRAALESGWLGIRFMAVFLLTIWPLLLIAAAVIIVVRIQAKRKGHEAKKDDTERDEKEEG